MKVIWERYGAGQLNDNEASYLQGCVDRRRPLIPRTKFGKFASLRSRVFSRYAPRPCRRRLSGEERTARLQRKRKLGSSSPMPDSMRGYFTEGERAVSFIVADEVKRTGECSLSIDEIADRAGVGRTTVRNYLHEARRLGHIKIRHRPRPGAKHLPNVVTIASAEWLTWIIRAPSAAPASNRGQIFKNVSTSKNIYVANCMDSSGGTESSALQKEESGFAAKVRWWLPPPVRTASGGWA
jgi:hypothetical protein